MPENKPTEEELFSAALELGSAEERLAFLEQNCVSDEALKNRVLELLEGYEQGLPLEESSPVAEVAPGLVVERELAEKPGSVIDRYKLLEKIGEGGFGVVYLAEQREPVVRKVALKVIKLGMDTNQVIARFEAERQALALMDHPNIARIIDAGATETGRPYFVMELVTGVSITRYCEEAKLGVAERLKLFIPVCQAVQHDLGEFRLAREILEKSYQTRVELFGEDHPDTLAARIHLARAQSWLVGGIRDAFENAEGAVELYESILPTDHRDLLHAKRCLARIYYAGGRGDEARQLAREVVEQCRKSLEPGDLLTLQALNTLGVVQRDDEIQESFKFWKEAHELSLASKKSLANHPVVLNLRGNLANAHLKLSYFDQNTIDLSDEVRADHFDQAFAMFKDILNICEDLFKESSLEVAISRSNLAIAHAVRDGPGDLDRAVELHESALPGFDDPGKGKEWLGANRMMGSLRYLQGKPKEAIESYQKITGDPDERTDFGIDWLRLGALLAEAGDMEKYEAFCERCLEAASSPEGPRHKGEMVRACLLLEFESKDRLHEKAIDLARSLDKKTWRNLLCRGMAEYRDKKFQEAIDLLSDNRLTNGNYRCRGAALAFRAMAELGEGRMKEAERLFEEATSVIETSTGPEHGNRHWLAGEASSQGWMVWHDDLICRLALAEARTKLLGKVK